MPFVLGMKASNYHYGILDDAPERYFGGITYDQDDCVVSIVDRIEDAVRFATLKSAEYGSTKVTECLRVQNCHHDPGYAVYPLELKQRTPTSHEITWNSKNENSPAPNLF